MKEHTCEHCKDKKYHDNYDLFTKYFPNYGRPPLEKIYRVDGVYDDDALEELPEEKKELLRMCAKWADKVYKVQIPKSRSVWKFEFDEGAYKGCSVASIRQSNLSPLAVLNMLDHINWPGFQTLVEKANKAIMEIFKQDDEVKE